MANVELVGDLRTAWFRYLRDVDAARAELHRMCRERTEDIWAAEALLQQTLADGFAGLARENDLVANWQAYLREKFERASSPQRLDGAASAALVDVFIRALQERDAATLRQLLADDFQARVFPFPIGRGKEQALSPNGWVGMSLREQGRARRLQRMTYLGESLVVVWNGARAHELWRLHGDDHHVSALDDYVLCPETQTVVATELGLADRFDAQSCLALI